MFKDINTVIDTRNTLVKSMFNNGTFDKHSSRLLSTLDDIVNLSSDLEVNEDFKKFINPNADKISILFNTGNEKKIEIIRDLQNSNSLFSILLSDIFEIDFQDYDTGEEGLESIYLNAKEKSTKLSEVETKKICIGNDMGFIVDDLSTILPFPGPISKRLVNKEIVFSYLEKDKTLTKVLNTIEESGVLETLRAKALDGSVSLGISNARILMAILYFTFKDSETIIDGKPITINMMSTNIMSANGKVLNSSTRNIRGTVKPKPEFFSEEIEKGHKDTGFNSIMILEDGNLLGDLEDRPGWMGLNHPVAVATLDNLIDLLRLVYLK